MRTLRFLYSSALSPCCNYKALLVKSREGGFISRNCLKCGKPHYVNVRQLPELVCDFCENTLRIRRLRDKNYHYICDSCELDWELPGVLPGWSELFQYSGLAAPGDPITLWDDSARS